VISRISHNGMEPELVTATTTLSCGDKLLVVASPEDTEAIVALLGKRVEMNWHDLSKDMISRRIIISKPKLNGVRLSALQVRNTYGVTITRINRTTFTNVIADLNLGSVVYPKRLASEQILAYVRARQNSIGSNVETLYNMFDNRVEALEFHINPGCPLIGIPLMKLQLKSELLVVCIGRNGKVIFPRGNDVILAEDTVTVITTHTGFHDISDILA
jgi:Trk K+ transport system NAD-binding subunit